MKTRLIVYPFLAGIAPVLILFANNLGEVEFPAILRSLLVTMLITLLALLIGWLWLHDWHKAGILASVMMISALAYGHIYDGLKATEFLIPFARHRFLLVVMTIFLLGVGWFLWKRIKSTEALEFFFTWFCLAMLVFPLYRISLFYLFPNRPSTNEHLQAVSVNAPQGTQPDIYYIILDGYGRSDTLKTFYHFDNSAFVNQLTQLGFYVPARATSNYPQTLLSLASSLNFQYIDDSLIPIDPASNDRRELIDKVAHSHIRQILKDEGYTFVAFDTGYSTSIEDADIYYKYLRPQNQDQTFVLSMNSFEGLLFEESLARPLLDFGLLPQNSVQQMLEIPYMNHAGRTLAVFEKSAQIPRMPGNYFVFAHVVAPHPPFVFGAHGELLTHTTAYKLGDTTKFAGTRDEYIQAYRDQASYINDLTLKLVKKILAESDTPPIIIIQGDHGPGGYLDWTSKANSNMPDRFSILNAYYLAGKTSPLLYPSISPVNTFRVVLNEFFGADLKLLPDKSYFALWLTPYQFEDVTSEVTSK